MRVLVAYGSKFGGTQGVANMIGQTLRNEGIDADVAAADSLSQLARYDAVIVGASLYMNRWQRSASKFVKRHAKVLRSKPVWFFSSGPLSNAPTKQEIPPVPQVRKLIERVNAREHITFGGKLDEKPKGLLAKAVAKRAHGDFRDAGQIEGWAKRVADSLQQERRAPVRPPEPPAGGQDAPAPPA